MKTKFLNAIANFSQINILVIGDLMLDHYITGRTDRTSPEAPVPVVLMEEETFFAGGAANVARNLAAAGANIHCIGATGNDQPGSRLKNLLTHSRVDATAIQQTPHFRTTVKTRIVSQGQQIVRLDSEQPWPARSEDIARLLTSAEQLIDNTNAIVISDYGKGLLTPDLLHHIITKAREKNIPVVVDPKGRDYARYRGATAITPNNREAREASGIPDSDPDHLLKAARQISETVQSEMVVITCGADGIALLDHEDNLITIATSAREVYDVTGAGDTFVSWFTLSLAAGLSSEEAARLANIAAGISVGRTGPAVVTPLDIQQTLASDTLAKKIISTDDLSRLRDQLKAAGKRIVLTNGCFDFLHAGHLTFLQHARALGDVLILAMNTDESIQRLKGSPRPIIKQTQRAELLASIHAVDYITIFSEDTPHEVIKALQPDILAKGSNYSLQQIEGADLVKHHGGEIVAIPIIHDIHTSQLFGQQ